MSAMPGIIIPSLFNGDQDSFEMDENVHMYTHNSAHKFGCSQIPWSTSTTLPSEQNLEPPTPDSTREAPCSPILHICILYFYTWFHWKKGGFFFFNMKSAYLSPLILQMRKMKVSEGKTHSPRSQSKLGAESELESRSLVFQVSGKYEREAGRALIG